MDSVIGEVKVAPYGASPTPFTDKIEAVKWGIQPGILTVACGGFLHDFDTNAGSRPTLVAVKHTHEGSRIRDFALYPIHQEGDVPVDAPNQLVNKLYNHRALVVLEERQVFDMAKHTHAPVSFSQHDGRVFHSLGASLFMEPPKSGKLNLRCTWSLSLMNLGLIKKFVLLIQNKQAL